MTFKIIATYATAAAVLGILVGCAGAGGSGSGNSSADDSSDFADLPAGTAVVRVEQTGGFVTPQTTFSRVPDLAVYADGRTITPGPQIRIFPPPALPSLQISELSDAQVERIVDIADDAGLLNASVEYGEPNIADATTTVVTIVSEGETYVHEAYALSSVSLDAPVDPDSDVSEGVTLGIDAAAAEARSALSSFIAEATTIASNAEAEQSAVWEPDAYSLRATPAQAASAGGLDGTDGTDVIDDIAGESPAPALPWEIADVTLSAAAECVSVEGEQATQLRDQLAAANELSLFKQADGEYQVWIRPVYPDEIPCAVAP
ncbi:hypothetical protein B0I08_101770 [Glaciihabitans tibetensis]|uniref:Uncharacterized protein n=1 Tax=Glaciihabitans tibetensis TaxID=1266600 RepID=A0A2T0VKC0_9MICO|nr:hypothetical protein [Glaciihabitans tibetensis]PRY70633.1 hypothetical protein B0I08_101770 [Glaciihabitans tibetensis]